jgi:hypothetical protein
MIEINKVTLVSGPGGSRIDFVSGWLGTLPLFVDNEWGLDPLSGASYGQMRFTKGLDYKNSESFSDFCKNNFIINPKLDVGYVGSLHGFRLDHIKNSIVAGHVELIFIDVSTARYGLVPWEFIVKTYLTKVRTNYAYSIKTNWLIDYQIDKSAITDQDRACAVKNMLRDLKHQPSRTPPEIPHKLIEYNLLFQVGGSRYLCAMLNLPAVDERYHTFWDYQLPLSTSPDSLVVWGETWNKADYFNN